ncbi:hypothetical protein SEA_FAUST_243 [Streptomyces phage Faust]|uniref:Uncharacterized protein n=1 Tax=Streptomyces phage Faust TaxID=2767565 RepID=A0A7G9UZ60_9CAUD|nr:hypothetical protein PP456_gp044 [Streptomyces phage Faust]QNN99315.1 hypothetical protein SEA_FAUST_243 [Streptomyces phage Faust]
MSDAKSPVEGLPVANIDFTMYPDCVDIHYSEAEGAIEKPLTMRLTRAKFRRYMVEMRRIEAYFNEIEMNEPLKDWEKALLEGESGE